MSKDRSALLSYPTRQGWVGASICQSSLAELAEGWGRPRVGQSGSSMDCSSSARRPCFAMRNKRKEPDKP